MEDDDRELLRRLFVAATALSESAQEAAIAGQSSALAAPVYADAVGNRFGETLEWVRAQLFQIERCPDQGSRPFSDHHLTRFRKLLKPRRQIRRFPCDGLGVPTGFSDQVTNHHPSARDADTGLKFRLAVRLKRCHRLDRIEAGPERTFSLILVGLWPTEIATSTSARSAGS